MSPAEIAFLNERLDYKCLNCRKGCSVTRLERASCGGSYWTCYACGRMNPYSETLETVPMHDKAPEGFIAIHRRAHQSEKAAIAAARKLRKRPDVDRSTVCIVHASADRFYGETWHVGIVGFLNVKP